MGRDYHKKATGLESKLDSIRNDFEDCSSSIWKEQLHCQGELAHATGHAMSTLKTLIQNLGSYQPTSITNSSMIDLGSTWTVVDSRARDCCRCASECQDSLLSHGDDLKRWVKEAKLVQAELQSSLRTAHNDVASEAASLQKYHEELQVAKDQVDEMTSNNMEIERKYFAVHEWTTTFPTAWDFERKLQMAMRSCARNLEQAEVNLDKSMLRVSKSENKLDSYKSRLETLSAVAQKAARVQAAGNSLLRRYRALTDDAEEVWKALTSLKDSYSMALHLVTRMNVGMPKLESAMYLLGIINLALDDHTLVSELAEVVHYMEHHYDNRGRVQRLDAPEHPDGFLNSVQKKLRSQQLQAQPPRPFDMCPIREDVSTKPLAVLHLDMMRSVLTSMSRNERQPCPLGRQELTDMLRDNIRMTWEDAV
ncbi:hypothetical protein ACHAPT_000578 [Fusarium lateritium]